VVITEPGYHARWSVCHRTSSSYRCACRRSCGACFRIALSRVADLGFYQIPNLYDPRSVEVTRVQAASAFGDHTVMRQWKDYPKRLQRQHTIPVGTAIKGKIRTRRYADLDLPRFRGEVRSWDQAI